MTRYLAAAPLILLAACGGDRSVTPLVEETEAVTATVTIASVITAHYDLLVGQSMRISPKSTSRTNRLKWTSTNSGVASVSSTGTVSAKTAGLAVITVSGTGVLESYEVDVAASAPAPSATVTGFSLQPSAGVTLNAGATQQFATNTTWSDGQTRSTTVTYTATGGTISNTGLFTAGNLAGTFMVIATCACTTPAIADTTLVSVVVPQLTKLTVSPKTVSLNAGASQQFAVSANWSTGETTVPPVTWSASAGTVSSTGAYVAPSTAGTYQVIVKHTAGTVADTAVVTVGGTTGSTTPTAGAQWSIVRDFNSGVAGGIAERTADGFDDVAGNSVYSSQYSADGSQAVRLSIDSGSTGWGEWGGIVKFPRKMVAGEEIWIDVSVFLPSEFDFATAKAKSKFMRVATKTSADQNSGYNDLFFSTGSRSNYALQFIKEQQFVWFPMGTSSQIVQGRWHRYTVHLRLDAVSKAAGGRSQLRVWLDGKQLIDEPRVQSLTNSTDYAHAFYLFTYWADGAPSTQQVWADNIRLSSFRPAWASNLEAVDNY